MKEIHGRDIYFPPNNKWNEARQNRGGRPKRVEHYHFLFLENNIYNKNALIPGKNVKFFLLKNSMNGNTSRR